MGTAVVWHGLWCRVGSFYLQELLDFMRTCLATKPHFSFFGKTLKILKCFPLHWHRLEVRRWSWSCKRAMVLRLGMVLNLKMNKAGSDSIFSHLSLLKTLAGDLSSIERIGSLGRCNPSQEWKIFIFVFNCLLYHVF